MKNYENLFLLFFCNSALSDKELFKWKESGNKGSRDETIHVPVCSDQIYSFQDFKNPNFDQDFWEKHKSAYTFLNILFVKISTLQLEKVTGNET